MTTAFTVEAPDGRERWVLRGPWRDEYAVRLAASDVWGLFGPQHGDRTGRMVRRVRVLCEPFRDCLVAAVSGEGGPQNWPGAQEG